MRASTATATAVGICAVVSLQTLSLPGRKLFQLCSIPQSSLQRESHNYV